MNRRPRPIARGREDRTIHEDVPYTMLLPDRRTVLVLVPAEECERDASGEIVFKPQAVKRLDRVRVLALNLPQAPTPGFVRTLREALSLTQTQLGRQVGVDKMTVYRWERGMMKPGPAALRGLEKLRRQAGRRGVPVAA